MPFPVMDPQQWDYGTLWVCVNICLHENSGDALEFKCSVTLSLFCSSSLSPNRIRFWNLNEMPFWLWIFLYMEMQSLFLVTCFLVSCCCYCSVAFHRSVCYLWSLFFSGAPFKAFLGCCLFSILRQPVPFIHRSHWERKLLLVYPGRSGHKAFCSCYLSCSYSSWPACQCEQVALFLTIKKLKNKLHALVLSSFFQCFQSKFCTFVSVFFAF